MKILGEKSFTLIEMIVVIFVVGIGLIGALSFYNINISNQIEVKNELIAAGLAQECADFLRNIRDYNLLNGNAWDQNLANCSAVDFTSLTTHQCLASANANVCMDGNSRYCQCRDSCPNSTSFKRTIKVTSNDSNSKKIECVVEWSGRKTVATDYLFNISP